MLKRLSEAISQSNIESDSLASENYRPNHSSCNFGPKPKVKPNLEPGLRDIGSWILPALRLSCLGGSRARPCLVLRTIV